MSLHVLSDADVKAAFGDPTRYIRPDGTVNALWEDLILDKATLPSSLPLSWDPLRRVMWFRCHERLSGAFTRALHAIHNEPAAWATIGDFGGCYAWRMQRRSKVLSRHSWGIAIDLDVRDNPMGNPSHVHPRTIQIMEEHGFAWGGEFSGSRVDPMHWEWAGDLSRLA